MNYLRSFFYIVVGVALVSLIYLGYRKDFLRLSDFHDVAKVERQAIAGGTTRNILLWNPYPEDRVLFGSKHIYNVKDSCPVNDCFVTQNHSYFPSESLFDAIVFLVPHIQFLDEEHKHPSERRPEQRYVFYSEEPALKNHLDLSKYRGFFNWTLSFQHYSDIPLVYGRIERKRPPKPFRLEEKIPGNKTKLVAWFVSTCWSYSNRETYVEELKKYVPVDIFGGCGPFQCPKDGPTGMSDLSCYEHVEQNYKFYLSFENSLCNEYVTEKFFMPLQYAVVPITLGKANYSSFAPPHSFINAMEYSPKQLADFLLLLDSNDNLYAEYFRWKNDYIVHNSFEEMTKEAYCKLCDKLHNDDRIKIYDDMDADWSIDTQCSPKLEFPQSNQS